MRYIVFNANVHTMDTNKQKAEAFLIEGNQFIAVGPNEEILSLKTPDTEVIDAKGKTVIPGFNDSHMHVYSFGLSLKSVNLADVKSVQELIEKTRAFIDTIHPAPGSWIKGRGWNQDYFDVKVFPTRYDLDKISEDYPVVLSRACGHILAANSKALSVCGINRETPQIEGGKIDKDANGEPLGIFREQAMTIVLKNEPKPSLSDIKDTLVSALKYANSRGLTSIQTDDLSHLPDSDFKLMLKAYEELTQEGKLTCRIYEQCLLDTKEKLTEFLSLGYQTGFGTEFFKTGPLKILSDGSLGARTAALRQPYHDDPSTSGIMAFTEEELTGLIKTAHTHGMQIAVHCIGDRAMETVLNLYEQILMENPRNNHRHGIIHCQITDEDLLNRFKKLGVLAYVQPIFLHYDLHMVEDRVGKKLAETSYAFKTMLNKGIHVSYGTDCPVESLDPFPNLYCAVTRKDLAGYPQFGFNPGEKVSVHDALYQYAMGSAYASFEENIKGSITEGKLADYLILKEDPLAVEPEALKTIEVLETIVGGKTVYKK